MTFRIETATRGTIRVFIVSGCIDVQAIAELKTLLLQFGFFVHIVAFAQ